jgi:hypothetical protein
LGKTFWKWEGKRIEISKSEIKIRAHKWKQKKINRKWMHIQTINKWDLIASFERAKKVKIKLKTNK